MTKVETDSIKVRMSDLTHDLSLSREFLLDVQVNGILNPIVCEQVEGEIFVRSGFRRLAAAKLLSIKWIPVKESIDFRQVQQNKIAQHVLAKGHEQEQT